MTADRYHYRNQDIQRGTTNFIDITVDMMCICLEGSVASSLNWLQVELTSACTVTCVIVTIVVSINWSHTYPRPVFFIFLCFFGHGNSNCGVFFSPLAFSLPFSLSPFIIIIYSFMLTLPNFHDLEMMKLQALIWQVSPMQQGLGRSNPYI